MKILQIDTNSIHDAYSFHVYLKELMGFPDFYGGNMNAPLYLIEHNSVIWKYG
jgi:RNAse (barnase) inhibitor barstar